MRLTLTLFSLVFLASACADETALIVTIDGSQLNVPDEIGEVVVRATGDRSGAMQAGSFPLDGTWPQSVAIRRGSAEGNESVLIEVYGRRAGASSWEIRRVVRDAFVDGESREVNVVLSRACYQVRCPDQPELQDCNMGVCDGQMTDAGTDTPIDAGDDTGRDAGVDTNMPDTNMPDTNMPDTNMPDTNTNGTLIISEYVEGSSNNKAIELYNASGSTITLSTCVLSLIVNCGSSTTSYTLPNIGLVPGGAYVFCNSSVGSELRAFCDDIPATQVINHNGNDLYTLECGGTLVDTFGSRPECASGAWADRTLRRSPGIVMGDTNLDDALSGWESFPSNTFGGLGSHSP